MTGQTRDRITSVLVRHCVFVSWQPICRLRYGRLLRTTLFGGRILLRNDFLLCVYFIKPCQLYDIIKL